MSRKLEIDEDSLESLDGQELERILLRHLSTESSSQENLEFVIKLIPAFSKFALPDRKWVSVYTGFLVAATWGEQGITAIHRCVRSQGSFSITYTGVIFLAYAASGTLDIFIERVPSISYYFPNLHDALGTYNDLFFSARFRELARQTLSNSQFENGLGRRPLFEVESSEHKSE